MKAVIMAGGEGSRLRPLTCTLPKPMARILGKPIIEYIFDLLVFHGITDAVVTLGYMPESIEQKYYNGYKNLNLSFIREDEPLGTAGSIKNAVGDESEPFIVISGDAMCGFDLTEAIEFHKNKNAKITIVGTSSADPREYGIVKVDTNGRVVGFVEKPAWSQAVSDIVNTGIYIVEPNVTELIPKNTQYDFARDLFPLMLKRDMAVYCTGSKGYWCDVGNIEAYMKCQSDLFDGKMPIEANKTSNGIYVKNKLPEGNYNLIPPVYIGNDVTICDNAVIGPYSVIDDGAFVGSRCHVRYSTVLENSILSDKTMLTGSLVCSGAALKKNSSMYENSVAGSGSVIGNGASIKPNVLVWPGKIVSGGANVDSNVKYGSVKTEFIGENGIDERDGVRLDAETCVRIGEALGSTRTGKKTGIANDGSNISKVLHMAVISGLSGVGASVWDFGKCFEAQLNYLVNFSGLSSGVFVNGGNEKSIKICGEGGLSVPRSLEREIESKLSKGEFGNKDEKDVSAPIDMKSAKLFYEKELVMQAPYGLEGTFCVVRCDNTSISSLMNAALKHLGCEKNDDTIFFIDDCGTKVSAEMNGETVGFERLLAVCCLNEMKKGHDISVPYDAPMFLEALATEYGKKVYRYLSTPADNSDSYARRLAAKQLFVRDGLFMTVKLLSIMHERECELSELLSELPEKHILRKTVSIGFSPADLAGLVGDEYVSIKNDFEGIKLKRKNGKLLIVPERNGKRLRLLAEADTMEAADELCADAEEIFRSFDEQKNGG